MLAAFSPPITPKAFSLAITPKAFSLAITLKAFRRPITPKAFSLAITPKAFANPSPGLERSDNPGETPGILLNPVRVRLTTNPFRVNTLSYLLPQGSRSARTLGWG